MLWSNDDEIFLPFFLQNFANRSASISGEYFRFIYSWAATFFWTLRWSIQFYRYLDEGIMKINMQICSRCYKSRAYSNVITRVREVRSMLRNESGFSSFYLLSLVKTFCLKVWDRLASDRLAPNLITNHN